MVSVRRCIVLSLLMGTLVFTGVSLLIQERAVAHGTVVDASSLLPTSRYGVAHRFSQGAIGGFPRSLLIGRSLSSVRSVYTQSGETHKQRLASAKVMTKVQRSANPLTSPRASLTSTLDTVKAFLATPNTGYTPPDTQVAAGPSDVVEAVNGTLSVWSKNGMEITASDLKTFFSIPVDYQFSDPRILYDASTERFFITGFAFDAVSHDSSVYVGVSATSDPTGTWRRYIVATSTTGVLFDQAKLGLCNDKLVISWSDFKAGRFSGEETWVLQKSDLLLGSASVQDFHFGPDATRFDLVPVDSLSTTNTEYVVYNNSCGSRTTGSCTTGTPSLGVLAITGTPAAGNVAWTESDPSMPPTSVAPGARQPGNGPTLDSNDDRLLSAVWRDGSLWVSGNDACIPSGDASIHSCFRIIEVSTTPQNVSMVKSFDIGVSGADLLFPAVTVDAKGSLFVTGSLTSGTTYASLAAFEVLTSGQQLSGLIMPGAATYGCSSCSGPARWGDYSGIAVDPIDPLKVWVAGEFAAATSGDHNWGTAIGELTTLGPAVTAINPNSGTTNGGTRVNVTGTNFTAGSLVSFGTEKATSVAVQSGTSLTATTPTALPGSVDVIVTTPYGTSTASATDVFSFTSSPPITSKPSSVPTVTKLSPNSGPNFGGTRVTIIGKNFSGITKVYFGATVAAHFKVLSPTRIIATSPVGVDTVSVTVASDLGVSATTANNWFSYGLISSKGYLLVSAKGDVYRFGDAHLYGSLGDRRLRSPIVAFATTPDAKGYLLVSAKGDVYRFGDAHLYGSLGDRRLRSPIVAFATTPSSVVRSPEGHE